MDIHSQAVAMFKPVVKDEPYKHRKLERPTTIRLIRVMPKKVNDDIACTIFHADREELLVAGSYQALSYMWGDQKPTRRIYLRDNSEGWQLFALHESLWKFLDHVWRNNRFDLFFWTDHICLDQSDHNEIAQQVSLMGDIYSAADLVVVWLEFSNWELEVIMRALEWHERLANGWFQGEHKYLNLALDRRPWEDSSISGIISDSKFDFSRPMGGNRRSEAQKAKEEAFKEASRPLMLNPYWQRVWIVQEVVMARRVQVMSEKFSLSLEALLAQFHTHRFISWGVPSPMWEIWEIRQCGGSYPLWALLRDFGSRQTSRPADRVYGFLGMVAEPDNGLSSVRNISVDYEKPTMHVLLDAIFESPPPLSQYGQATQRLLPGSLKNYNFLEEYINSSRTSKRHSDFARLAHQVLEAVEALRAVLADVKTNDLEEAALELFQRGKWEPTLHQNGAIMGLVFASYIHVSEQRSQNDRGRLDAPSPWRCAAHMHRVSHEQIRMRTVKSVVDLQSGWFSWDTQHATTVCGEKSEICDFSTMVADISDIGFRLLLETDMNGCREARLRLQLEKSKSKGSVGAIVQKAERSFVRSKTTK